MSQGKIYLDLAPELRRVLDDSGLSVEDVLRREDVDLPLEIGEEELPAMVEGERERDIGIVLMATAALTISLGAAASMVILALSRFYKDREHAPKQVANYAVKEIVGSDGKLRKRLVLEETFIQPDSAPSATELEVKLGLKEGATVKFHTKDE